ncbi:virulence factor Mce family protein [Mycobacterium haemophilum]|uniref:Mammalian cell entry protein n=1 Tax=Mycobacterium haemophilum TaxID=29311 RepID=A0A0I9U730_9MYCO|nr:virulence factor Mce family protein [Mycobacterium haemophilum]AKN15530.1 mammalian cell entry protein [Mycobacterium haemophilum DSM 44634]KLO32173.1 mammalian cell entry protein [Mycobacterium haemophilum]KLO36580.1 mammalian cell entry protein [Mycobacterium haemophilum]KLO42506.1 mammalian cell entry protein [Mycobacterium haemophilum]KLO55383.1 mammalian cell entry protein [Mycobacterium haemophilum]
MSAVRAGRLRYRAWQGLVLLVVALLGSSCGWRGISNVSIPGGPGSGEGSYTIYVQVPDTLAINGNSKVMVADVTVGSIRAINLKNWVATLTLGLNKGVKLPKNATAKIGQTSLLGSQHVELAAPANPSPELLKNGDTIPLQNSSAFPTTEQTLASLSLVLRGGGIPNLETLTNEVFNIFHGRADQIHVFLTKLDTFVSQLNEQRDDITHAIDSTNRLLTYVGGRSDVLDRVLTDIPPLIKHFADTKNLLINATDSVGQLSQAADQYLSEARGPLHTDLQALGCPLRELGRASPYLIGALKLILTQPYDVDTVPKMMRGDYQNVSLTLDVTYSAMDNAVLTGTGLSGALRALEQSFGRDPETMIPDVRYTPNPNDAPGGPLVERADRRC